MNVSPSLKQWQEEIEAKRAARKELMMNLSSAYLKLKEEVLNEGEQQGLQLGKLETVPILAELGLSVADIAQRLSLPIQHVAKILERHSDAG